MPIRSCARARTSAPGATAALAHYAVEPAPGRTARQLGRILTKHAADLDDRTFRGRHADERARRHVYIRNEGEGMSTLVVYGPTLKIRAAYDILSRVFFQDLAAPEVEHARLIAEHAAEDACRAAIELDEDRLDARSVARPRLSASSDGKQLASVTT